MYFLITFIRKETDPSCCSLEDFRYKNNLCQQLVLTNEPWWKNLEAVNLVHVNLIDTITRTTVHRPSALTFLLFLHNPLLPLTAAWIYLLSVTLTASHAHLHTHSKIYVCSQNQYENIASLLQLSILIALPPPPHCVQTHYLFITLWQS